MSREVLAFDVAVAVVLAGLVLIISPGVAVAGMIALLVLVVCLASGAWDARRGRGGRSGAGRPRGRVGGARAGTRRPRQPPRNR